jgi:hypothetical protein
MVSPPHLLRRRGHALGPRGADRTFHPQVWTWLSESVRLGYARRGSHCDAQQHLNLRSGSPSWVLNTRCTIDAATVARPIADTGENREHDRRGIEENSRKPRPQYGEVRPSPWLSGDLWNRRTPHSPLRERGAANSAVDREVGATNAATGPSIRLHLLFATASLALRK